MKQNIWVRLKAIDPDKFNRFLAFLAKIDFGNTKAASLIYDEESKDICVFHYARYMRERKYVAKAKGKLKKLLKKHFPDREVYLPTLVPCAYKLLVGYADEFIRGEGMEYNIFFSCKKKGTYTFSVSTVTDKGTPFSRAYKYNRFVDYESVHREALMTCWKRK